MADGQRVVQMDREAHVLARGWISDFDFDKDGKLSFDELQEFTISHSENPEGRSGAGAATRALMKRVDSDGNGSCSTFELMQFAMQLSKGNDEGNEVPRLVAKLRNRQSTTGLGDALDEKVRLAKLKRADAAAKLAELRVGHGHTVEQKQDL